MRKHLHEIEEIDRYLRHKMTAADKLVFRARMIINPELKEKVKLQRKVQQVITWLSRDRERRQLEGIYTGLLSDEGFSTQLKNIFK